MKKHKHYFWISGLLVVSFCVGALAVHQHSKHQLTTAHITQSSHSKPESRNSTSAATRKKEGKKRLDLFELPNEKKITDTLVKSGKEIVDSRKVSNETSRFDFAALAQGDFSSLAGTWQDANGFTFEFSPQGLVSQDGKLTLSALAYDDNGEAVSQVSSLTGGFILYYYSAGKQIPNWHFNITDSDPSDYGRDRLFAAQLSRFDYESTQQFVNGVFYKVSDNYSKVAQNDKNEPEQEEVAEETTEEETAVTDEETCNTQENTQTETTTKE
ncbi:DUF6287 domain-containing protein [Streptococcus equinus]|uniref:DUF6287 domain-containing protein n=1 Tax=Streptococcus equinus TaxID=1335 RepID=UPI003BF7E27C